MRRAHFPLVMTLLLAAPPLARSGACGYIHEAPPCSDCLFILCQCAGPTDCQHTHFCHNGSLLSGSTDPNAPWVESYLIACHYLSNCTRYNPLRPCNDVTNYCSTDFAVAEIENVDIKMYYTQYRCKDIN